MSSPHLGPNPSPDRERPWRWVIIALIFLVTVITYLDRLALPTLAPELRTEFQLTNVQYAWIANSFLFVYALSMFLWGAVIFTFSTGWVVDHFSYTPILITAAVLAPLATASLFLLSGRVRRLELH